MHEGGLGVLHGGRLVSCIVGRSTRKALSFTSWNEVGRGALWLVMSGIGVEMPKMLQDCGDDQPFHAFAGKCGQHSAVLGPKLKDQA